MSDRHTDDRRRSPGRRDADRAPAFQLYAQDLLSDANVLAMALDEFGAYMKLLVIVWNEHGVANDPDRLARMLHCSRADFDRIWGVISHCFYTDGGGNVQHQRLDRERRKQTTFRKQMQLAGREGGLAKARNQASLATDAPSQALAKRSSSSSSSSSSTEEDQYKELASTNSSTPSQTTALEPVRRASDFQSLWNEITSPPIPRCRDITVKRRQKIQTRIRERSLDEWRHVFERIAASAFCRGESDRGGWVASFDWIIDNPDNAVKVLEGKYDDREPPPVKSKLTQALERSDW